MNGGRLPDRGRGIWVFPGGRVLVGFGESSGYKGEKAASIDDLLAGRTLDAFAFAILKDIRFANRF